MTTLKQLAYQSRASQDGWEVWQLLKHVKEINPKVIVEVGVDGGGFLETLTKLFPQATIVGIDINENKVEELKPYKMIFANSRVPSTAENLKAVLNGQQIDFLWIDGDHNYQACKDDFENFFPQVRSGGIIGFHDTNNRGLSGVEVDQFLAELDEQYSYRHADYRLHRMSPGTRVMWK